MNPLRVPIGTPGSVDVVSTSVASPSTPELLVVHALRVRGFVDADVVVEATGLPADDVAALLGGLGDAGHARHREGRISGWMLTPDGRAHGEALLSAELDAVGCRSDVEGAYRRFLAVNADFLALCTDWQLRPDPADPDGEPVVNDHADVAWDAAVVDRLGDADAVVGPICDDLAGVLHRFDGYRDRFAAALARVRDGDGDWFARPMIDSYHTVWFELHENLLATLGIERAKEHAA